jgi:hypothetical protein
MNLVPWRAQFWVVVHICWFPNTRGTSTWVVNTCSTIDTSRARSTSSSSDTSSNSPSTSTSTNNTSGTSSTSSTSNRNTTQCYSLRIRCLMHQQMQKTMNSTPDASKAQQQKNEIDTWCTKSVKNDEFDAWSIKNVENYDFDAWCINGSRKHANGQVHHGCGTPWQKRLLASRDAAHA